MPGGLLHDREKEIIASSTCSRDRPGAHKGCLSSERVLSLNNTELQNTCSAFFAGVKLEQLTRLVFHCVAFNHQNSSLVTILNRYTRGP